MLLSKQILIVENNFLFNQNYVKHLQVYRYIIIQQKYTKLECTFNIFYKNRLYSTNFEGIDLIEI